MSEGTEKSDDGEDEESREETQAQQNAEAIYNARGNINLFLSQYKEESDEALDAQLEQARELLEKKKHDLYEATQAHGWNSKDATSLAEDCALFKDRLVAVKQVFAARGRDFPTNRLDGEKLKPAVERFQQREEARRRREEEEREAKQSENSGCLPIVVGAVVVPGILIAWLLI